jgi:phosphoribosylglycinamide formyltransferase-1
MIKIAFYVSGRAGRLHNILKWNLDILNYTKLIFTDSQDALYLNNEIKNEGLEFLYFDYEKIKLTSQKPNLELSNKLLEKLNANKIDYCFSFGNNILRGSILDQYKNKLINFHPSLLPAFPGRLAINQALNTDVMFIGHTAHFIDEGIDTGKIIAQMVMRSAEIDKIGIDTFLDFQIYILQDIFSILANKPQASNILNTMLPQIDFFYDRIKKI